MMIMKLDYIFAPLLLSLKFHFLYVFLDILVGSTPPGFK